MLLLAISSQKSTLIGILSNISHIWKKKGLIFFGQKLVILAIVKTTQNKQQTAQSFFCEITTA